MKIAVTFEDGQVFQHFGKAKQVKIYEIEDGTVVSAEVIQLPSAGHSIIARAIFGQGASAVICGNIKPGAAEALQMSGIQLFAGISGTADDAAAAYINGTLVHHPEACRTDEECGHHDDED